MISNPVKHLEVCGSDFIASIEKLWKHELVIA